MWKTAFRFITYDRGNMWGILAGIVVSDLLVGLMLSQFNTMMGNSRGLTKNYPNQIWVVNPKTQSALQFQNLDVRAGRELQSIPGVKKVYPLIFTGGTAKSPKGNKLSVNIIGIKAPEFVGAASTYTPGTNLLDLVNEGAIILNNSEVAKLDSIQVGQFMTINDKRVYLSGLSMGLTGFGTSYVITTIERARNLSGMNPNYVNAYLVDVDTTQTTREAVMQQINSQVDDVRAVQGQTLGDETLRYNLTTSNVIVSFLMMVVISVVGGFAVVGITLYSSVNDRIRDYGTVKAIGGSNGLIRKLIPLQGVIYAFVGFGMAYVLLRVVGGAASGGDMAMTFPGWLVGSLVGITTFISIVSSLIAMRKITKLEPVQIFRM